MFEYVKVWVSTSAVVLPLLSLTRHRSQTQTSEDRESEYKGYQLQINLQMCISVAGALNRCRDGPPPWNCCILMDPVPAQSCTKLSGRSMPWLTSGTVFQSFNATHATHATNVLIKGLDLQKLLCQPHQLALNRELSTNISGIHPVIND